MLEVLVPAANKQLTTLTAVKAMLDIPEGDTSRDVLLNILIDQASDAIVRFCGRPFAQEKYRETLPGYGGTRLMLSRVPVIAVESILYDNDPVVDYVLENQEAGFLYRAAGWCWTASHWWNITSHPAPGSEEPKFVVTYTAGYVLPGDQGTRTLPQDIERACIEAVRAWFLDKTGTFTAAGGETKETELATSIPLEVTKLLAPWRRIV